MSPSAPGGRAPSTCTWLTCPASTAAHRAPRVEARSPTATTATALRNHHAIKAHRIHDATGRKVREIVLASALTTVLIAGASRTTGPAWRGRLTAEVSPWEKLSPDPPALHRSEERRVGKQRS